MKITLPDGSQKEFADNTTLSEIAVSIGARLGKESIAAVVDDRLVDLDIVPVNDSQVRFVTFDDPEGKDIFRHSASHVMAQAVKRLFPGTELAIGPSIKDGFYYDFEFPDTITEEDLPRIEEEMNRIVSQKIPYTREELPRDDAIKMFKDLGEAYKVELIEEIDDETVSIYRQDDFVDMCRGPHVPDTGYIKSFALLSLAGAYWRGDEKNKMLQRIYGTAYPKKKTLKEYLNRLEEAKKRDHRRLGRELDLFSIVEEAGPGFVIYHPKGALVRTILEDFEVGIVEPAVDQAQLFVRLFVAQAVGQFEERLAFLRSLEDKRRGLENGRLERAFGERGIVPVTHHQGLRLQLMAVDVTLLVVFHYSVSR